MLALFDLFLQSGFVTHERLDVFGFDACSMLSAPNWRAGGLSCPAAERTRLSSWR